jgi:predicted nuclease of predicted toxin-antitoxin system
MSFRFKLDENLPRDAEALFLDAGFDAHDVLAENLGGAADPLELEACRAEDRILVTLDLDFADIRAYPPSEHPGIWVLRPPTQGVAAILEVIAGALKVLAVESPTNRLWVVEHNRVRVRE